MCVVMLRRRAVAVGWDSEVVFFVGGRHGGEGEMEGCSGRGGGGGRDGVLACAGEIAGELASAEWMGTSWELGCGGGAREGGG